MSFNKQLVTTTKETGKGLISNTETDKPQASQNKSGSLDKSRSSSRTKIEDTLKPLNKTISTSPASLYNKDNKKQQPKEIKFQNAKLRSDNPSVSSMFVHGASITTVSPETDCIFCKIKRKLSEILITGNKITQEPDNPSKKSKMDISIDEKNII